MTNTNTTEWGNIELPGLSDEDLFKKDWNKVAAARERAKDPIIKLKLSKANTGKIHSEVTKKKLREINTGISRPASEKTKKLISEKKKGCINPNKGKKLGPSGRIVSLETKKKLSKAISKPFITPTKVFDSQQLAAEHYSKIWNIKVNSALRKIQDLMKKLPNEWKYK
jgi:hypothetical protein